MKKIWSIVLLTLFTMFLLTPIGNLAFAEDIGISFGSGCLTGMGKGCFHYEKIIGIDDQQQQDYTATSIAQDVVFAATYMVGTVLTIVIIYCGLMYIFAAKSGKDPKDYKDGLVKAVIGSLLVRGAYAIVRLIQYIAKGSLS